MNFHILLIIFQFSHVSSFLLPKKRFKKFDLNLIAIDGKSEMNTEISTSLRELIRLQKNQNERDHFTSSSLGIRGGDYKAIPIVYCHIKVWTLRKVDEREGVFDVDFQLDLDWEDPLVSNDFRYIRPENFDYSHYFDPAIIIENSISNNPECVGGRPPNRLEYTICANGELTNIHMHRTERYRLTLYSPLKMVDFPFDDDKLSIKVKSLPIPPQGSKGWVPKRVLLRDGSDGYSPRLSWKHELSSAADGLSEWVMGPLTIPSQENPIKPINNLNSNELVLTSVEVEEEDNRYYSEFEIQIQIVRECWSAFWSLIFPLMATSSLGFMMYASPPSDVNARLCNTITCCLTVVLFKYYVSDRLPNVAYLTVLDKYLVSTTFILLYQGFGHACAGFLSEQWNDYFHIAIDPIWSHYIDVFFWSTSIIQFFSLQIWILNKLKKANIIKLEYEKYYNVISPFTWKDGVLDKLFVSNPTPIL